MKIERTLNAAMGAFRDRRLVTKDAKHVEKLNPIEAKCYHTVKAETGPSVHNPIKVIKSLYLAYQRNIERQKKIEEWNAPFKQDSEWTKAAKQVIKKIAKFIKK